MNDSRSTDRINAAVGAPVRFTVRLEREGDGSWVVRLETGMIRGPSRDQVLRAAQAQLLHAFAERIARGEESTTDILILSIKGV